MANTPAAVKKGGSLDDGRHQHLRARREQQPKAFWRYNVRRRRRDTWTTLTDAPANVGWGGA